MAACYIYLMRPRAFFVVAACHTTQSAAWASRPPPKGAPAASCAPQLKGFLEANSSDLYYKYVCIPQQQQRGPTPPKAHNYYYYYNCCYCPTSRARRANSHRSSTSLPPPRAETRAEQAELFAPRNACGSCCVRIYVYICVTILYL